MASPVPCFRRRIARYRVTPGAVMITVAMALQAGCGDGSDDPSPPAQPTATSTGRFVDAAVSNLGYRCSGLSGVADVAGVTDSLGQFDYVPGQSCSFSAGGVVLGSALGASLLTPASLVPGAVPGVPNTTVTNIVRFLMSIDDDMQPDNGISIAAEVNAALAARTLDFASPSFDTDAAAVLTAAVPGRGLTSAAAASAHLDQTLVGLYAGAYACTYRGMVGGVDALLGNVSIHIGDGVIAGSGVPAGGGGSFDVAGTISSTGAANLSAGTTSTGASFQGSFSSDGTTAGTTGSGTWTDTDAGSGTWGCQHS